jgi:predicted nucleic acid-binding protein
MKLYLETTVPSFLFADDAPEKQEVTRQFFKWLAISPDKLYISELVLAELNRASPDVRNKLLEAVVRLPVENLSITDEAVDLAGRYVRDGVIPAIGMMLCMWHWQFSIIWMLW